jgi:nitroreductase
MEGQTDVLEAIRTRRVTRQFKDEPVPREQLELILEGARWAPSGGNRRLNVYIAIQDRARIRKIRAVSPGMLPFPPAIILICLDTAKSLDLGFRYWEQASAYVDLGTAMENMLLIAHTLGLGACPVMSFHRPAVQLLLDLPEALVPEVMIMIGQPPGRLPGKVRSVDVNEFTHWESYGRTQEHAH